MAKLFFARYHFLSAHDIPDKIIFLQKGLENIGSSFYRDFTYKFLDSKTIAYHGNDFLIGSLVKYAPNDKEKVVDDSTMTIQDTNLKNKVIGQSQYIIDPSSSVIMFFEVPNAISKNAFIKRFSDLFKRNHDIFTEIVVTPIKERYSFVEEVKSFQSIKKIVITLYPSNPNFSERWKSIDERLRTNNISKYKEIQESKESDSSINIDEETESKFLMSEDGYGKSEAKGIDSDGNEKTISTGNKKKDICVDVPKKYDNIVEVIRIAMETLQDIVKRTE